MIKTISGALLAAALMFAIGFGFYATPVGTLAFRHSDPAVAAKVQAALAALPATGMYAIPDPGTADGMAAAAVGPSALVHVTLGGVRPVDPAMLALGFAHYVVIALMFSLVLAPVASRSRFVVLIWTSLLAVTMIHLAGPIWWHKDWTSALFFAVADAATLIGGGIVVARFLPRKL